MQDDAALKELQKVAAYLQQMAGQLLTHQEYQKKRFDIQSQKHDQQIHALTQSAQAVSGSSNRLISEAAKGIREQTRDAIARGAAEELASVREKADAAARQLLSAAELFAQQKALLDRERKNYALTWMRGITIVTVLAVFGVSSYLAAKTRQLEDLSAKTNYLSVYNAADVAPADDKLWVNIDLKTKQTVNGKTYYLVKQR